jgi:quinoprotein glucose dehydrogenase
MNSHLPGRGTWCILLAALVVHATPLRAADDDEPAGAVAPAASGLKGIGTRKPVADLVPASDEPLRALQRMKAPDGFEIKLWAAEPLLAKPVAIAFDERGRLFVAETHRYRSSVLDIREYRALLEDELASRSLEDRIAVIRKHFGAAGEKELGIESDVIRLLEDTNGDGVADKSTLYADGFHSPLDGIAAGLLARRGEVWLTNIPNLWRLTGEQQAERRTELSRGYGLRFNYVGHDMHGPIWGPDGKIYYSIGDRGANVKTKEGGTVQALDYGAVFRCKPDGSQLEVFALGLRNPQSLAFNEFGDLFTGDNDSDQGDEERLVHVVDGGDSGWRIGYQYSPLGRAGPWNTEKLWHPRHADQPAYMLAPIANIEDGPAGIAYYPGTGLNPAYRGALFVTHYRNGSLASSGIFTYKVKSDGAAYAIADAKVFLAQALPTDVKFGPDGRIYFSDWADHLSRTYRGRIYAISDTSQAGSPEIRETQQLLAGAWTKRPPAELAQLLGHADWRVRLEAQFELAERGAPVIALLAQTARANPNALARRHAIWGLGQIAEKTPSALEPLRTLLTDPESEVRAQSLKVLGEHRSTSDAPAFIAALGDANGRVKFFAAQALGKIGPAAATPALFAALRANNDRDAYLRHALVMGLVGGKDVAALAAASSDASPAVRLGALLALLRLLRPETARFLNDSVPFIAREAAEAINDAPIPAAYPELAAVLGKKPADEAIFLRAINAHFRLGQPANAVALARHAADADAPVRSRTEALIQLALWPKPPARDRVVGVFRPQPVPTRDRAVAVDAIQPHLTALLASSAPAPVQTAVLQLLQDLEIAGAADALYAAVGNEAQPGATRASALNALDRLKDPRVPQAVQIAATSSSAPLRLAAMAIAARLSPDAVVPVLSSLVAKGTVEEQRAAFGALSSLKHPAAEKLLTGQLQALEQGKVQPAVQIELLNAASRRPEPAIKALLAARDARLAADPDPLAPFRVALAGGDRVRGNTIFRSQPTLACLMCHRLDREGGDAGPDLTDIGNKHPREYLLESVVRPNAKIATGYDSVVLTRKSGGAVVGIVTRETPALLSLRQPDGKVVDVPTADIARRDGAPSAMPEIYGTILTKSEIRDVVEFLASLKGTDGSRLAAGTPRALRGVDDQPPAQKKRKKK